MNWIKLEQAGQLEEIDRVSQQEYVLIYKHSTRCGISSAALRRLEQENLAHNGADIRHYFLDLLKHRDLSAATAERYGVRHESPQVLLIRNGRCVYHASHSDVSYNALLGQIPAGG